MIDADKSQFWKMMNVVMEIYSKPQLSRDAVVVWYGQLEKFDIDVVSNALDKWVINSKTMPTPKDILDLCKPQVTIHQRLASPLRVEDNKKHVEELKVQINKMTNMRSDMKGWARKIIANPGNYPDISIRFAKEALGVE